MYYIYPPSLLRRDVLVTQSARYCCGCRTVSSVWISDTNSDITVGERNVDSYCALTPYQTGNGGPRMPGDPHRLRAIVVFRPDETVYFEAQVVRVDTVDSSNGRTNKVMIRTIYLSNTVIISENCVSLPALPAH